MKIVADETIPDIIHYLGEGNELILKQGRLISQDDLFDADILLTRSTTKVNKHLLHDTPVKFVGSTVAGLDHLDMEYLDSSGIKWFAAEGCNAVAVSEYVVCVVAALQKKSLLPMQSLRAAVIGVGRVGRLVVQKLKALGFDVVECDPFYDLTPIDDIAGVDLICLHTPLTRNGKFPTYHMIDKKFLARQKEGAVLLNAGRGGVIDSLQLKKYGKHLRWCLDVFENEPDVDLEIVDQAEIVTPHIAGHSVQAKLRGLEMVCREMIRLGIILDAKEFIYPRRKLSSHANDWRERVLETYNPEKTSREMKQMLLTGSGSFDKLRKNFVERYEFDFVEGVFKESGT